MKTVLPDSNVIIDLFNGIRTAAPRLAEADRILLSPTVLGEVCSGFSDSEKDRSRKGWNFGSKCRHADDAVPGG